MAGVAEVDEDATERAARRAVDLERVVELPVGDDAGPHEELAEPLSCFCHLRPLLRLRDADVRGIADYEARVPSTSTPMRAHCTYRVRAPASLRSPSRTSAYLRNCCVRLRARLHADAVLAEPHLDGGDHVQVLRAGRLGCNRLLRTHWPFGNAITQRICR